jgi:formylglycine-generating enzyme required for sulfatase activity
MANDPQADLCDLIAQNEAVLVVGTGVSVAASGNAPTASWPGLLRSGVDWCGTLNAELLTSGWMARQRAAIAEGTTQEMIAAADLIAGELNSQAPGEFTKWLEDTVGTLRLKDRAVLDALIALGLPFTTTNYDHLIEQATGLPAVSWLDSVKVEKVLHGREKGVLHLHGKYDQPDSVVLGIKSYETVKNDAHAQAVLTSLRMTKSLLFVGCGDGLSDPNFGNFLTWTRAAFPGSIFRQYCLVRESERAKLQAQHPLTERIVFLSYGQEFTDLAPFLKKLKQMLWQKYELALLKLCGPLAGNANAELAAAARVILARAKRFLTVEAGAQRPAELATTYAELAAAAREILARAKRFLTVEAGAQRPAELATTFQPGQIQVDPRTGIAFIHIPAGEFDLGSETGYSDEKPVHRVRISKPFLLGKYQVTNQEYQRFLEANPKVQPPGEWSNSQFNDPQQPVVGVSWEEAQVFCRWAGGRLPTEGEWEYACQAGSQGRYCFGDDEAKLGDYAWYYQNSGNKTHPVGQKQPNAWGLYDVHGNVWEWCQDWYGAYSSKSVSDPQGPATGSNRVIRGGCWDGPASYCRSAQRGRDDPSFRHYSVGFRLVLAPGQQATEPTERSRRGERGTGEA